jgi:signal transduction histidine kinase
VLQHVGREQERLSGEKRCEFHIEALPNEIGGDVVLIEQALGIVIANAMRYSTEKVVVEGRLCGASISIVIKDAGIGISPDDLPFVSQPFFRGANARHLPGTGLGLSLARHILSLHGGELRIESEERKGTTVRVRLPCNTD